MAFLHLDGPAFSAILPACWLSDYSQNPLEASRYLAVLAEFEREEMAQAAADSLLGARLDLALLWLARSLNQAPAGKLDITLGLEEVLWRADCALPTGQRGVLAVQISTSFPFSLQLPVQIISSEAGAGEFLIRARFLWPNEELRDWYERTVFRYHRRDIQHRREA